MLRDGRSTNCRYVSTVCFWCGVVVVCWVWLVGVGEVENRHLYIKWEVIGRRTIKRIKRFFIVLGVFIASPLLFRKRERLAITARLLTFIRLPQGDVVVEPICPLLQMLQNSNVLTFFFSD